MRTWGFIFISKWYEITENLYMLKDSFCERSVLNDCWAMWHICFFKNSGDSLPWDRHALKMSFLFLKYFQMISGQFWMWSFMSFASSIFTFSESLSYPRNLRVVCYIETMKKKQLKKLTQMSASKLITASWKRFSYTKPSTILGQARIITSGT